MDSRYNETGVERIGEEQEGPGHRDLLDGDVVRHAFLTELCQHTAKLTTSV
jgi:hypothetical protein